MTAKHTELDTRNQKLRDMLTIRVVDFLERLEEPITTIGDASRKAKNAIDKLCEIACEHNPKEQNAND